MSIYRYMKCKTNVEDDSEEIKYKADLELNKDVIFKALSKLGLKREQRRAVWRILEEFVDYMEGINKVLPPSEKCVEIKGKHEHTGVKVKFIKQNIIIVEVYGYYECYWYVVDSEGDIISVGICSL